MKFILSIVILCAAFLTASAQLPTATVSGTTYNSNGQPVGGVKLRVVEVRQAGTIISTSIIESTSASNGTWSMVLPRNSIAAYCTPTGYPTVPGISSTCSSPTRKLIPDASTATFGSLVTQVNFPTQGIILKNNGVLMSGGLITTIDFTGSVFEAASTESGIATVSLMASGVVAGSCALCDLTVDQYGRVTAKASGSASDLPSGIDAAKIADGSVSNSEFQRLDGGTENIQSALNAAFLLNGSRAGVSTATTGSGFVFGAASLTSGTLLSGSVPASGFTGSIIKITDTAGSPATLFRVDSTGAITTGSIPYALVTSKSVINADVSASAAIAYSKLNLTGSLLNADISPSAAIALNKLASVTASRVLVSDGSGVIGPSSTTATEIGFLSGVTSGVQGQLDSKTPLTRLINTGAGLSGGGDLSSDRTFTLSLNSLTASQTIFDSSQASRSITFGLSGSSDPVLTASDNVLNLSTGTLQQGGVNVVTESGTQTLSSKTLTTPTIASFINATHTHQDAAGGGQLNAGSVFNTGSIPLSRGGTGADLSATGGANQFVRQNSSGGVFTVSALAAADMPSGIDALKIGAGLVNNAEFAFLDGVTSALQTQLDGKVTGPASATDNAIARYDLTTGKLIQNSGATIDDNNTIATTITGNSYALKLTTPNTGQNQSGLLISTADANGAIYAGTGSLALASHTASGFASLAVGQDNGFAISAANANGSTGYGAIYFKSTEVLINAASNAVRIAGGGFAWTAGGKLLVAPSTASVTGSFTVLPDNSATAALVTVGRFGVNSSGGVGAAGFGPEVDFSAEDSTTLDTKIGSVAALWTDATHGTRTGAVVIKTTNAGVITERFRVTDLGVTIPGTFGVRSTGTGNFDLQIANTENLTASRSLTVALGDASRTLTLSGNASISGTNTGDQTITLTGDVTGSGTGSFAATVANNAVSYAKLQDVSATQRILGRNTAGSGDPEEVTATQVLDWIGSTRGSLLYRGTSGWAALTPGTSGYVLTSNGSGADPTYQAASGGANTALSNLASVAINTSLLPGTDNSIDLGSASKRWASGYLTSLKIGNATNAHRFAYAVTKYTDTHGFLMYTDDGSGFGSGTGSLRIHPASSSGFGSISSLNDAGFIFQSLNSVGSIVNGEIRLNVSGVTIDGGAANLARVGTGVNSNDPGRLMIGASTDTQVGRFTAVDNSATTNDAVAVAAFGMNTSGTPAIGLGTETQYLVETSTTANTLIGSVKFTATTITHASRTGKWAVWTVDAGGSNAERLSLTGSAGTFSVPALLSSGVSVALRTVTASTVTGVATDTAVLFNCTSNAITYNMVSAVGLAGRVFIFKKADDSINAVTLTPSGAQTIDGASPWVLTGARESITVVSDGANWQITGVN